MQTLILGILLIFGLFLPTSINGEINSLLLWPPIIILCLIYTYLIWKQRTLSLPLVIIVLIILSSLLIGTLLTPYHNYAFGSIAFYFLLCYMFLVRWGKTYVRFNTKLSIIINFIIIILGLLVVFGNQNVQNFFVSYYSDFYTTLVPNMMESNKPVLSFATHSLAGFFMYLFFFLNIKTFKQRGSILYFLFSIGYLYLMINIKSVTSLIFCMLAIIEIIIYFFKKTPLLVMGMVIILILVVANYNLLIFESYKDQLSIAFSGTNGFIGRYSSTGNLANNIDYIVNNPFHPIGFGYSKDMFYGDSGFIEYITRGSLPLLIGIYGGLFYFLKKNMVSRYYAYQLFAVTLFFESGFSVLIYFRILFLLPFFIVYLNSLKPQIRG